MFTGSFEFGTTLWGWVPHILVALLAVKLLALVVRALPESLHFDRADGLLLAYWGSFFLLLEFFPNGFQLDAYYSVPRIFRYLAPISFPIAVHAAKVVLDVTRVRVGRLAPGLVTTAVVAPVLALFVVQCVQATGPSAIYRENLLAVLRDIRAIRPPQLLAESILASYFRDLYLEPDQEDTEVVINHEEHAATDYERWLHEHEPSLPEGTLLVTGLASFVHYGAHIDGYRLEWFKQPLGPEWKLVHEYGVLTYLPRPEPARIWRYTRPASARPAVQHDVRENLSSLKGIDDPAALFAAHAGATRRTTTPARIWFRSSPVQEPRCRERAVSTRPRSSARPTGCARATSRGRWRASRKAAGARRHWHIAMCDKYLRRAGAPVLAMIVPLSERSSTVALASTEPTLS
jgi:hypothetical protein